VYATCDRGFDVLKFGKILAGDVKTVLGERRFPSEQPLYSVRIRADFLKS